MTYVFFHLKCHTLVTPCRIHSQLYSILLLILKLKKVHIEQKWPFVLVLEGIDQIILSVRSMQLYFIPYIIFIFTFLPSLGIYIYNQSIFCRKVSHLNLLLQNHWTKLNQTWFGWSLSRTLSKLCPIAQPSIQDHSHY
jgi:hypothetical protein